MSSVCCYVLVCGLTIELGVIGNELIDVRYNLSRKILQISYQKDITITHTQLMICILMKIILSSNP